MSHLERFQDNLLNIIQRFPLPYDHIKIKECHHLYCSVYRGGQMNYSTFEHKLRLLRYIFLKKDDFSVNIQTDDICSYGLNKHSDNCLLLHHIIASKTICQTPQNLQYRSCKTCNFKQLHVHKSALVDRFLSIILLLYEIQKHKIKYLSLHEFAVSIEQFTKYWYDIFKFPPIFNITQYHWVHLLSEYNNHYDRILWRINETNENRSIS